jgi:hypothetical protein
MDVHTRGHTAGQGSGTGADHYSKKLASVHPSRTGHCGLRRNGISCDPVLHQQVEAEQFGKLTDGRSRNEAPRMEMIQLEFVAVYGVDIRTHWIASTLGVHSHSVTHWTQLCGR